MRHHDARDASRFGGKRILKSGGIIGPQRAGNRDQLDRGAAVFQQQALALDEPQRSGMEVAGFDVHIMIAPHPQHSLGGAKLVSRWRWAGICAGNGHR